jgi:hypothetical protein
MLHNAAAAPGALDNKIGHFDQAHHYRSRQKGKVV